MARDKAARARRPAPDTPALLDVRVVLVAAVVASPAAYRASQGLLTPDQAMGRFLVVLLAVAAMTALVRAVWPLVAGETAGTQGISGTENPETPEREDATGTDEVSPPPG